MRRSAPCKHGSFPDKYRVPTEINIRHITKTIKLANSWITLCLATRLYRFFTVKIQPTPAAMVGFSEREGEK